MDKRHSTEVHDGSVILTREPWLLLALAFTADVESFLLGCMALLHKIVTANLWVEINRKMLPYCESTEAFVWGKRQKIIADSCQGFQEEW